MFQTRLFFPRGLSNNVLLHGSHGGKKTGCSEHCFGQYSRHCSRHVPEPVPDMARTCNLERFSEQSRAISGVVSGSLSGAHSGGQKLDGKTSIVRKAKFDCSKDKLSLLEGQTSVGRWGGLFKTTYSVEGCVRGS